MTPAKPAKSGKHDAKSESAAPGIDKPKPGESRNAFASRHYRRALQTAKRQRLSDEACRDAAKSAYRAAAQLFST